ncbi:MAG: energy transducer TonB [Spirochaetales bacterium]|nr:energy transducer TonB [Spirochaetales bacterium]
MRPGGFGQSVCTTESGRLILSCLLAMAFHGLVFLVVRIIPPAQIIEPPASSVLEISISRSFSSEIGAADTPPRLAENLKDPAQTASPPPVGKTSRPGEEDPPPAPPEESPGDILQETSNLPASALPPGPVPELAETAGQDVPGAARGNPPPGGEGPSVDEELPAVGFAALSAGRNLPLPAYPAAARRFGYQGTVTLAITVAADGSVSSAEVLASSGHSLLDMEAQNTVRKKWSFHPPGKEVRITKEFVFSLSS